MRISNPSLSKSLKTLPNKTKDIERKTINYNSDYFFDNYKDLPVSYTNVDEEFENAIPEVINDWTLEECNEKISELKSLKNIYEIYQEEELKKLTELQEEYLQYEDIEDIEDIKEFEKIESIVKNLDIDIEDFKKRLTRKLELKKQIEEEGQIRDTLKKNIKEFESTITLITYERDAKTQKFSDFCDYHKQNKNCQDIDFKLLKSYNYNFEEYRKDYIKNNTDEAIFANQGYVLKDYNEFIKSNNINLQTLTYSDDVDLFNIIEIMLETDPDAKNMTDEEIRDALTGSSLGDAFDHYIHEFRNFTDEEKELYHYYFLSGDKIKAQNFYDHVVTENFVDSYDLRQQEKQKPYLDVLNTRAYNIFTQNELKNANTEELLTDKYSDYTKYMTDEQKSLLCFFIKYKDKDYINAYLKSLEDDFNKIKGTELALEMYNSLSTNMVSGEKEENLLNTLKSFGFGIGDGIISFNNGVINAFENNDVLSEKEYAISVFLQLLDETDSEFIKNAYGIGSTVGQITPAVAVSAVASYVGGPEGGALAGRLLSSSLLSVSSFGNSKHKALVEGHSIETSVIYGVFSAATEFLTSYFLSGIVGIGDVEITSLKTFFQSCFKEALEEGLQEYLQSAIDSLVLGKEFDFVATTTDSFNAAFTAFFSTALINGAETTGSIVINGVVHNIDIMKTIKYMSQNEDLDMISCVENANNIDIKSSITDGKNSDIQLKLDTSENAENAYKQNKTTAEENQEFTLDEIEILKISNGEVKTTPDMKISILQKITDNVLNKAKNIIDKEQAISYIKDHLKVIDVETYSPEWKQTVYKYGNVYADGILGFVNGDGDIFLPSDANTHTIYHEIYHALSEIKARENNMVNFDTDGNAHRKTGIIEFFDDGTMNTDANETLTDYLADKSDNDNVTYCHSVYCKDLWKRLDNAITKETGNPDQLESWYINNDTDALKNFFKENSSMTFEEFSKSLYTHVALDRMEHPKLEKAITKIEKKVGKPKLKNMFSFGKTQANKTNEANQVSQTKNSTNTDFFTTPIKNDNSFLMDYEGMRNLDILKNFVDYIDDISNGTSNGKDLLLKYIQTGDINYIPKEYRNLIKSVSKATISAFATPTDISTYKEEIFAFDDKRQTFVILGNEEATNSLQSQFNELDRFINYMYNRFKNDGVQQDYGIKVLEKYIETGDDKYISSGYRDYINSLDKNTISMFIGKYKNSTRPSYTQMTSPSQQNNYTYNQDIGPNINNGQQSLNYQSYNQTNQSSNFNRTYNQQAAYYDSALDMAKLKDFSDYMYNKYKNNGVQQDYGIKVLEYYLNTGDENYISRDYRAYIRGLDKDIIKSFIDSNK